MNTIKTALVVIVLLAVSYGVWTVLNKPPASLPVEVAGGEFVPPDIRFDFEDSATPGMKPPGDAAPEVGQITAVDPATLSEAPAYSGKLNGAPQLPNSTNIVPTGPMSPIMPKQGLAGGAPTYLPSKEHPITPIAPIITPEHGHSHARGSVAFAAVWSEAQRDVENDDLRSALARLSQWHGSEDLNSEESRKLLKMLDQLAGTVIYSREHRLMQPYKVRRGDDLQTIAKHYKVPWQMLSYINGIDDPSRLFPGDLLKVVKGPFTAHIDLESQELTLKLNGLYACRFAVGVGQTAPQIGDYQVRSKMLPGDASNYNGQHKLELGGSLWIQGQPDSNRVDDNSISVSPIDARNLYALLSVGSPVVIR